MQARRADSEDENDRIVVFFIRGTDKKVYMEEQAYLQINGKDFEAKVAQMAADLVKRVVLVFGGELTSDGKKVSLILGVEVQKLNACSTADMIVEGFTEDELVVDITEHELVRIVFFFYYRSLSISC